MDTIQSTTWFNYSQGMNSLVKAVCLRSSPRSKITKFAVLLCILTNPTIYAGQQTKASILEPTGTQRALNCFLCVDAGHGDTVPRTQGDGVATEGQKIHVGHASCLVSPCTCMGIHQKEGHSKVTGTN